MERLLQRDGEQFDVALLRAWPYCLNSHTVAIGWSQSKRIKESARSRISRCNERVQSIQQGAVAASLPMLCHESRLRSGQIRATLSRQQRPVSPHVAHEHVEPLLQRAADDLAALH